MEVEQGHGDATTPPLKMRDEDKPATVPETETEQALKNEMDLDKKSDATAEAEAKEKDAGPVEETPDSVDDGADPDQLSDAVGTEYIRCATGDLSVSGDVCT